MSEIEFVKNDGTQGDGPENGNQDGIGYGGPYGPDADVVKKRSRKKRNAMIVIVILLVIVLLAGIFQYCLTRANVEEYGGGEPYLAVLHVEGTIQSASSRQDTYQHDWQMSHLETLMNDENNTGILLYINSPGGSVYQTDEFYLKLKEYQERTQRPVYAYFAETAASGAYYIAADADMICANRNTTTGSIGVYLGPIISAGKLLENLGVEVDIIRSSENKAMGNSYESMTDDQRAIYQSLVDEMYGRFVSIVAEGRNLNEEYVRQIADGRVYTAAQAAENGLVDKVADFDETLELMREQENLNCAVLEFQYTPPRDLYSLLFGMEKSLQELASQNTSEAQKALEYLEDHSEPGLYYLMAQ